MKTGFNTQLLFSPQNCTLDILDQTITPNRRKFGDEIINKYIVNPDYINYTLLIGPRGSGKTHLLTYIFKSLVQHFNQTDDRLILRFSEEERGIVDTMGFILACLRASDLTTKEISKIIKPGNHNESFTQIEELFDSRVGGRKVILFIENLGQTLGYFDDDELSKLRGFFQTRPNISVVASAISLFKLSNKPDHPFYGFFSIRTLKPLNNKGAREFLRWLAELNNKSALVKQLESEKSQARVNAIYGLTGGNHRLLSMLSNVLDVNGLCELVNPFVQMIDRELTPYYQQRLDRLTPQQNNIIRVIAEEHGRAITVKEIAQFTFSTSQIVSKQCHLLKQRSYIRSVKIGKESCYELNEPLLRIVLDMKEGRDEPLPIIINFLKYWYQATELKKLEAIAPLDIKEYYQRARLEITKTVRQKELTEIEKLIKEKNIDEALGEIETNIEYYLSKGEIEAQPDLIKLYFFKAQCYGIKKQSKLEIDVLNKVLNKLEDSKNFKTQLFIANALYNKGVVQAELKQLNVAIRTYDELIKRFIYSENLTLSILVAESLFNKGVVLDELNQWKEAIQSYDILLNEFGHSENQELVNQVARAMVNMAIDVMLLNDLENAIRVNEEIIRRFGNKKDTRFQEYILRAHLNNSIIYCKQNKWLKAVNSSKQALALDPSNLWAKVNLIFATMQIGSQEEALKLIDEAIDNFSTDSEKNIHQFKTLLISEHHNEELLKSIVDIYIAKELIEVMHAGVVAWIKSLAPLTAEAAEELKSSIPVLEEVFAEVAEIKPLVGYFKSLVDHALGDKKALMNIPLELRRLFTREDEITNSQ